MARLADAVAGTPVLSAWHNTNRDRTVNNFASAAERASQWVSPPTGAFSYLVDQPGILWYYTGTAWAAVASPRTGGNWARIANQSIPSAVETAILWDTETADTNSFLAITNSTVTIPANLGGIYTITTAVFHTFANAGQLELLNIQLTAGNYRWFSDATYATALSMAGSITVSLVPGNTIQVYYLQGTGGAQNVTAHLEVWKVGN